MRTIRTLCGIALLLVSSATLATGGPPDEPIRIGIIGLDTSHVTAFTKLLNDPSAPDHVPGARVVAGFKGGSPDIESSATRIDRFTAELRDKWKVEIGPDIPTLCRRVDAVLIESVDGRVHLEQVKPVFAAGKRVFIDKPLAASYDDARTIARLGREKNVAWFSSSSLRFYASVQALRADAALGPILGAETHGPSPFEAHHPDLSWYGIHAVEMLFTLMGPGCRSVTRVHTPDTDVVVGKWSDGRLGTFRGLRSGKEGYGMTVFGRQGIRSVAPVTGGYPVLVQEIVKFFRTGVPPVDPAETLEIMAFIAAADRSKARGGAEVQLSDVTGSDR
jgi:hypothetical protein